jgi:hypothetical protein
MLLSGKKAIQLDIELQLIGGVGGHSHRALPDGDIVALEAGETIEA